MGPLHQAFSEKTYERMFADWRAIVRKKECGTVIGMSARSQSYRIPDLVTFLKKDPDLAEYQFITINFNAVWIEDEEQIATLLQKGILSEVRHTVFIFTGMDALLRDRISLIGYLNEFFVEKAQFYALYFFETNIEYSAWSSKLHIFSTLYKNTVIFLSPNQQEVKEFIVHLEKSHFHEELPKKVKQTIIENCGNRTWFITEAVRYYCKTHDEKNLFSHPEMEFKLKTVYEQMDLVEKQVLEKIVLHQVVFDEEEQERVDFLLKTGTIGKQKGKIDITSSLLSSYIRKRIQERTKLYIDIKGKISVNGVIVDHLFSKRERKILNYFLKQPNLLISREKIFAQFWRDEDSGTDWALDQAIRRLRNKLQKIGLSRDLIKTKKNGGFIYSITQSYES